MASGRLTLTWAHKDKALVGTPDGGYEWVTRDDPRANEVRLLDEAGRHGDVSGTPGDNLLIRGDSLDALRALSRIPEYAAEYRGRIKLVYIDPPFNTQQSFEHYDDGLEHSIWLGMMRERLTAIKELLSADGSVWVHLDDAESAYCKVLLDEIFGRNNYIETVIWQKADTVRNDARRFSSAHDTILVYAKDEARFKLARLPRTEEMDKVYRNPDNDPRGRWLPVPLQGPNIRPNLTYEVVSPRTGKRHLPPDGNCWRRTREEVADMIADDRIYFGKDGNGVPQIKKFLTEVGDAVPSSVWSVKEVDGNRQAKAQMRALFPGAPFSTPKPEKLIERIVRLASRPGEIILDCFAGSGTTAAVAHKTGRRWITAEVSDATIDSFTLPRLRKVLAGADAGGITASCNWRGGGGFRELQVAESILEVARVEDLKLTGIAAGVSDERLATSVAAQLGFSGEDDSPPFVGRKGRTRLVVLRGVVDRTAIGVLLAGLNEGESLLIAATMIAPGARDYLQGKNKGSRIVQIPHALFPEGGTRR